MSSRYDWKNGPPVLENHSRCKHEIISDYLIQYMCVVTKGFLRFPNKKFNLTIVDGFAGGGKYLYENREVDGSPLVILKAVDIASTLIQGERKKLGRDPLTINTDFFFVEKEKFAADYLQGTLKNEGYGKARVIQGEFGLKLPAIIKFIKTKSRGRQGRAIFILDQCGFGQVLFDQINHIMGSLESEVILTFSVDALLAHFCEKTELALKRIGFTDEDITQIRQRDNPNECRSMIQYVLSKHILKMGFYFTPFCIYGDTSHWGYWLVHLSRHYRARDEMMRIHWNKANELVHYGGAGIDMFGYRSKQDEEHTRQVPLTKEFRFDRFAEDEVENSLRKEIPELIWTKGEILYCDLLNEVFNHTPAKREIINKVLWEGMENKELSVPRRNSNNIKDNDIIKFSPHNRAITFGPRK